MGDTIYSDSEVPGPAASRSRRPRCRRSGRKYRINLGQKPWVNARGVRLLLRRTGTTTSSSTTSPSSRTLPGGVRQRHINGKALYARGLKAFRDYNPIDLLDEERDLPHASAGARTSRSSSSTSAPSAARAPTTAAACDNPAGSGDPDLAPTAPQCDPQRVRADHPVARQPAAAGVRWRRSTTRAGRCSASAQLAKFEQAIKRSTATFKVIFNEVPIQQFYALPYDRWEGYAAERTKLLEFLQPQRQERRLPDHRRAREPGQRRPTEDARAGRPGRLGDHRDHHRPDRDQDLRRRDQRRRRSATRGARSTIAFFKPQPPSGVGMKCAGMDQFSYAQVTVGRKTLKVDLKNIQGKTVQDTADRNAAGPPCGPYLFQAQNHPPAG